MTRSRWLEAADATPWRCIGPPRGGRVVAVAGDHFDPMTFYFGACAGGVWKTVDGGVYWECVSDGHLRSAAVGALAAAPSDSNVVYAGMGETTIRIDVSWGDGVYRTTDAGRSWHHLGLDSSRHIGAIQVHPDDPDVAYVAALGDAFGGNGGDRGVYRTTDGGRSWKRVLHGGPEVGAVDLSMDPTNPRVLFATLWRARRSFWHLSSGGPGSGLWISMDGGDSWQDLSARPGMPKGPLGKIGVAASPARQGRVFALVEAEGRKTGLYRSGDYGRSWKSVCRSRDLMHRPWYYAHVFADPCDADTVYVNNLCMWKSSDGGRTFTEITTPHLDNHALWIDPRNPRRMVQGNDGGACVSFNGGETWSTIYNQCTAQFYRMDIDCQHPYRVYGTQQDNTTISVPSATEWGRITLADCTFPGTGESGSVAVHPEDPNVVISGAVGSSPGGNGALQRYDHRTRQIQMVNVWPEEATGVPARELRHRFAWTYPVMYSPHDSGLLYAAGSHVFASRDEGQSWQRISDDLSRGDDSKLGLSGGPLTGETAGAEQYGTCVALAECPHRPGVLFAGTDDGLVWRREKERWKKITPPDMPKDGFVACVEVSRHGRGVVYLAATRYKLADYKPYLWRSRDDGKSWQRISGKMPQSEITRVIRVDPVREGLLYAGTETGLYWSPDDGRSWRRMSGGLPVAPVYDLRVREDGDLVAATHGRSFWIADDIASLRTLPARPAALEMLQPRPAVRTKLHWSAGLFDGEGKNYSPAFGMPGTSEMKRLEDGTERQRCLDCGENPPRGAILQYWMDKEGPVTITVSDSQGRQVARIESGKGPKKRRPPGKAGMNRYVWDLAEDGPMMLDRDLAEDFEPLLDSKEVIAGPTVPPGRYRVAVEAGGRKAERELEVVADPRLSVRQEDFEAQHKLHSDLMVRLSELNVAINRGRTALCELEDFADRGGQHAKKAKSLRKRLGKIVAGLVNQDKESPYDSLRHRAGLDDTIKELAWLATIGDGAPARQTCEVAKEVGKQVDRRIGEFERFVEKDLADFNRMLGDEPVISGVWNPESADADGDGEA